MPWVSPISHNDPSSAWEGEPNAYDGNLGTWASTVVPKESWGAYLELIRFVYARRIRLYAGATGNITSVRIGIGGGDGWKEIYSGAFNLLMWQEFPFDQLVIPGVRVGFYNASPTASAILYLREVELFHVPGRGLDALVGETYSPRPAHPIA